MTDSAFRQDVIERQDQAVSIGVLQEQMRNVIAGQAEQKVVNAAQSVQLGEILSKLSEAKGGWRTLMWLGGAGVSLGGLLAWAAQHLTFR